jgi:cytochrome c peroxidase
MLKKPFYTLLTFAVLLGAMFLMSCGSQSPLDQELQAVIAANNLTGDPSLGRDLPHIEDPLAQLGMKLFFTKALGGEQDSACVTCHHPMLGGGDGIPLSIGVGAHQPNLLGPGRTHPQGPLVPRNAPTTFNAAMWDKFMFHDGRVESIGKTPGKSGNDGYGIRTPNSMMLGYPDHEAGETLAEAQARFPVTSEEEMRGFDFGTDQSNTQVTRDERSRELLAAILGNYNEGANVLAHNNWPAEFQAAFDSTADAETLITFGNIAKAIAAYENSQVFVDTPWRAYVQGQTDAISEPVKRGALLFYGKAGCSTCHSGDFFTDEQFHVLAIPQIGVGRDSGIFGDDDFGRYLETGEKSDKYAFRTPTLLNVEVTAPYGHDGAYETLEEILRHHLNPVLAVENYDFSRIDPDIRTLNSEMYSRQAVEQLEWLRAEGYFTIQDKELTDTEIDELLAFLGTLTDPCVKSRECLSPWIPDSSLSDPDGMRMVAVDEYGDAY